MGGQPARVFGYGRVSTEEQGRSGAGIDAQRASIGAEVQRRGWTLDRWVVDEGVSGSVDPDAREGLGTLLEGVRRGDVVVAAKLDRIARSALAFLDLARRAEADGWSLVVLDLDLDTTTPVGRFTATVLAGVAELERDLIAARTRDALAARKRQGVRLGRPVETPDDVRERIWRERQQGRTYQAIADGLNDDGITTVTGKPWSRALVGKQVRSVELDREAEEAA